MKKSKFTEEQIVGILRETDRDPVATVAKRHGVSDQAIYTVNSLPTVTPFSRPIVTPLGRQGWAYPRSA